MEVRYQTKQQRDSIELLNMNNKLSQQKVTKQRISIFSLLFGIILLASLLWFINKSRQQEKEKRLVEEDLNKMLNDKANELKAANHQLLSDIQEKDKRLQSKEVLATKKLQLVSGEKRLIPYGDIYYVKGNNNSVEIFTSTENEPYQDLQRLKDIKECLHPTLFIQIHRSYIINFLHVRSALDNKVVMNNGEHINVTKSYRASFLKALKEEKG